MTSFQERAFRGSTRFYAISGKEDDAGMHAAAHVDLQHEAEHPNFVMGYDTSIRQPSTEFFKNTPGQITGAFSDPRMRANVPTLLGMAGERNARMTGGRLPMPDTSLSSDSSALVQKLRGRGVAIPENPDNPAANQNNTIRQKDYLVHTYDDLGRPAKPEDVSAGRQFMRQQLASTKVNPNQFAAQRPMRAVQHVLPGMTDPLNSDKPWMSDRRLTAQPAKFVGD